MYGKDTVVVRKSQVGGWSLPWKQREGILGSRLSAWNIGFRIMVDWED